MREEGEPETVSEDSLPRAMTPTEIVGTGEPETDSGDSLPRAMIPAEGVDGKAMAMV